jgi:Uncharacterised conserved protein
MRATSACKTLIQHHVWQRPTDSNRQLVVETLRSLAELMIWGDQHDTRFFDFFAEKHLLSHFNRILRQPANRRGEVPQQVVPEAFQAHVVRQHVLPAQECLAVMCADAMLAG